VLQQRVTIEDALRFLQEVTELGAVSSLPYRWRREGHAEILPKRMRHDPAAGSVEPTRPMPH
jgi:hypothetical protein